MNYEAPQWEDWENRFRQLAEQATLVTGTAEAAKIRGAKHYLCLYGDNGLTPDEEFAELERMSSQTSQLKRVEVDTSYWQDTVLFVPSP